MYFILSAFFTYDWSKRSTWPQALVSPPWDLNSGLNWTLYNEKKKLLFSVIHTASVAQPPCVSVLKLSNWNHSVSTFNLLHGGIKNLSVLLWNREWPLEGNSQSDSCPVEEEQIQTERIRHEGQRCKHTKSAADHRQHLESSTVNLQLCNSVMTRGHYCTRL